MTSGLEWNIGICMFSSYDDDGFLNVQYDAEGELDSGVHPYETHSIAGCVHRPLDPGVDDTGQPIASQAAQLLFAMAGGKGHALVCEDPRTVALLPVLQKGETLLHSDFGQFVRLHTDGTITLFTTDQGGGPDGQSIYLQIGPDAFRIVAPWGTLLFDATGFHVLTKSGARFDLGGIYGAPAPFDKLTSYAGLQAATVSLDGSLVTLGSDGAPSYPLAQATPLQEWMASVATAIEALAVAVDTASGVSTSGVTPAQGAAAQEAAQEVAVIPPIAATTTSA